MGVISAVIGVIIVLLIGHNNHATTKSILVTESCNNSKNDYVLSKMKLAPPVIE